MKKILFLLFISAMFVQLSLFGASLKLATEAEKIELAITSISTKLFSKSNLVETPFTESEKNEWKELLRKYSTFIVNKAKGDSDILKNYSEVVFGANKLIEIQPTLTKIAKPEAESAISTLQDVVKSMSNVVNTYETLSKKITSKLWSSDKKDVWRLINFLAKYVQVTAQKIIDDYKKLSAKY